MIHQVFTVYDSKVEAFNTPFYFRTKGEAIRAFASTVNDSSSSLSAHPEDYTLFEIGSYDDSNASLDLHSAPVSVVTAVEVKE